MFSGLVHVVVCVSPLCPFSIEEYLTVCVTWHLLTVPLFFCPRWQALCDTSSFLLEWEYLWGDLILLRLWRVAMVFSKMARYATHAPVILTGRQCLFPCQHLTKWLWTHLLSVSLIRLIHQGGVVLGFRFWFSWCVEKLDIFLSFSLLSLASSPL